jgi:hypothetical protein
MTWVPPAPRPVLDVGPERTRIGQWVIELPFVTALSLNDRDIWQVKAAKVKPWRTASHLLAKQAKIPACRRIHVELNYVPSTVRRRDPDNLVAVLKPCIDGLVDAGVVPDDDLRFVERSFPVIHPKGPPRRSGNRWWMVVTAL